MQWGRAAAPGFDGRRIEKTLGRLKLGAEAVGRGGSPRHLGGIVRYRVCRYLSHSRADVSHAAQHETAHRSGQALDHPAPGQTHGPTSIPPVAGHGVGLLLWGVDTRMILSGSTLNCSRR